MKSTIIFVTGNERKLGEARLACEQADISVIQEQLVIDEIQSRDSKQVSLNKAKQAFATLKKPLVVTDTFWSIPALNGFPGPYMKDVANWFTEDDFLSLVSAKNDKSIIFSENITYIDKDGSRFFTKEFKGKIVQPRGTGISIENVSEFDGITLGERRERKEYSHSSDDYAWKSFVEWFKKNN